jgi:hypothetical protein
MKLLQGLKANEIAIVSLLWQDPYLNALRHAAKLHESVIDEHVAVHTPMHVPIVHF